MCDTEEVRTEPEIDPESSGKTFARVFGTSTNAFELLVVKRKIMGPCWLRIKKPHAENKGVSPGRLCSQGRHLIMFSDLVVQVRGDRVGPQRHQPIPGDRS
jgi:hypothetical protein